MFSVKYVHQVTVSQVYSVCFLSDFFPFTLDIKELLREQGSNNVIVTSAHREILRQSSQDTISKSATTQWPETSIMQTEQCLILPGWK